MARVKQARKTYTAEEKANCVINILTDSKGTSFNCRNYQIPESCFYRWRQIFIRGGILALKNSGNQKKVRSKNKPKPRKSANTDSELMELYLKRLKEGYVSATRALNNDKKKIIDIVENTDIKKKAALDHIGIPKSTYYHWLKQFKQTGDFKNFRANTQRQKLVEREDIKEIVFKTLHSPPSECGFNRTTWIFEELQAAIAESGTKVGLHTIRKIIKNEGYRWLKAKKVLTSKDPEYRDKLNSIHRILGNLSKKEGFFSIDEYGPFAVKKREGRKLVGPSDAHTIPQWQKSKGVLIITAAVELSTNQVTHFYSKKKDTEEMLKLLDILLKQNHHLSRIYLSWDAASWHISKKLFDVIENNNIAAEKTATTQVEVAPLPAGAQFLNVIEAIFSGMSRAVIRNSDYQSVEEAKNAIDRYFHERNQHHKLNPKRAGKKIWGKENTVAQFSESSNHKDRRYR